MGTALGRTRLACQSQGTGKGQEFLGQRVSASPRGRQACRGHRKHKHWGCPSSLHLTVALDPLPVLLSPNFSSQLSSSHSAKAEAAGHIPQTLSGGLLR